MNLLVLDPHPRSERDTFSNEAKKDVRAASRIP